MANHDEPSTNIEDLADDIEPGCNFGHIVASELRDTNEKVSQLHEELYQNGYVSDLNDLIRYVEEKEEEESDRLDFRQKVKIALISSASAGLLGALFTWLFTGAMG